MAQLQPIQVLATNGELKLLFYEHLELCKAAPQEPGVFDQTKIMQSKKTNSIINKFIVCGPAGSASTARPGLRPADNQLTISHLRLSQTCFI